MGGIIKGFGFVVVLLGTVLCVFSLFLVSCRFLHTLMVLEQMNCVLLVGGLIVFIPKEGTYFVSLLVMFTVEAVVGLVVLVRMWSGGKLIGLGWW